MTVIDESCIDKVLGIQWFRHCGEPVTDINGVRVEAVGSWGESLTLWNGDQLDSLQGEQRSRLQFHLFNHHRKHHALWNEMIDSVNKRLASGDVREALSPLLDHGFNELHLDVVMSQVQLTIMESSYAFMGCRVPHFFRTFLSVYSAGHLPCGWAGGEFPQGRLIAY